MTPRYVERVALVSEHASPLAALGDADAGGQNVHVAALAEHLARRGLEVAVYTRRDRPDLPAVVTSGDGYDVVHIDAGPARAVAKDELLPFMGAFADGLRRAWTSGRRPDVVHAHFWMSGLASCAAARPLQLPVVQTFHALGTVKRRQQGAKDTSPAPRIATETRLVRTVDHVIATCTDEVFELARMGGDHRRMSVIPCGVDLGLFTPDGPVALRGPRPRVLVVGRLVERKGVGNVIEALAAVPDAELVIAGGGERCHLDHDPEAVRLRSIARRCGVDERVELLGRIDHRALPSLMRSADLVVCAPWYEPFGIVPLEAMACGRPVLASAVGGLVDSVVDGVTGRHVPPRRPDLLGAEMRRMLADGARLTAMGRAARCRAAERYGWPRVTAATLACYDAVAARSSQPATAHSGGRPQ